MKRVTKRLASAFSLVLGVLGGTCGAVAGDVSITSVGQSSDGMMVKVLMKKMGTDPDYDSALSARRLGTQKVIIAVVGGSSKGLGAAGISREEEKARSEALLLEAKRRGAKVLVMHIGGDRRRGELTDAFIDAVAAFADGLIVVKSGNVDGIFSTAKSPSAWLAEVETTQAALPVLESTLREWGAR